MCMSWNKSSKYKNMHGGKKKVLFSAFRWVKRVGTDRRAEQ